jgi:hypothetical protein
MLKKRLPNILTLLQTSARAEGNNSNGNNKGKHNDNYNNSRTNGTLKRNLNVTQYKCQHISGKEQIDRLHKNRL